MNTEKRYFYLATMPHSSGSAVNHGRIWLDENDYVFGETPVEDFGMYYYRDEPFPENKHEIAEIFLRLMEESYAGLDDTLDHETKTCRELLKTEEGRKRLSDYTYFGGCLRDEVLHKIYPIKRN